MSIEERLANLELQLGRVKRRNRWLVGIVLLVALGVVIPAVLETTAFQAWTAAGAGNKVRANAFILEDKNGKVLALLDANEDGPILCLNDKNGKPRAWLAVWETGPDLVMIDEDRKTRIAMKVDENGPGLTLYDESKAVIWSAIK